MKEQFDPNKNYTGFSWMQKFIHPPFWWLYGASCYIHDDNYTKGGTPEDRLIADIGFFWRIVEDTKRIDDWKKRKSAVRTAIIYYRLVRMFGWIAFNRSVL